jgi:hypothetical protein
VQIGLLKGQDVHGRKGIQPDISIEETGVELIGDIDGDGTGGVELDKQAVVATCGVNG